MPSGQDRPAAGDAAAFLQHLKALFAGLPNDIPLVLFVDPSREDVYAQAIRQMVRSFREITDKISLREYPLDHPLARQWQVDKGPALLFAPETYRLRWLGAPLGEEARTFLELLLLVGSGESGLSEQTRKVLHKIDTPRHIRVFISATCPYCPQQAVNAARAVIERPDQLSGELIDIQTRPDLAQAYNAQSVPQTFAEDVLIGMGAQSEEVFALSLQTLEPQTLFIPDSDAPRVDTDVLIVGGGPAGLTAGIYTVRSGLKTALVERNALGGQVATTPVVENYPGFTQVGGKSLVDIMVSHALQYVQIFQGEEVLDVSAGPPFEVTTTRRIFNTRTLLLASGANHKRLGVPGETRLSGRGVSYCSTCDGPLFKHRKVLMVGGGNSAVTEALHLKHIGVDVTLVHRRDHLRAQDVLARQLQEAGIPILWNTRIEEIMGDSQVTRVKVYNDATQNSSLLDTDAVFVAIGYVPAVELAEKIGVGLTPEGYIQHDGQHRTSIPGIYSAGDVEGGYKQIVTAAGQGAEAAMTLFEDLLTPYWKRNPTSMPTES